MSQESKNIRSYVIEFQEQLLLSNSSLDKNTKIIIFKKGLAYKLQDKLELKTAVRKTDLRIKNTGAGTAPPPQY
ncbi:hypothetical protein PTT_11102 [Pyrenophora teres f. teres 0-1]|uniref:Uncharacterized protein n=1 Tax=Pyrenophora teres f. teres (strain 0-1) TaxID=861557 RepID=E3RQS3_PYRTT|nr:hypothetical protein PTT_11102 [Pyrenophora teres f. teres 0-1]